ncbi:MAG: response regulator [bacterium]
MEKISKKQRILLVEDDTEIQELLSALLKKNGFDVIVCTDGISAVNACKEQSFDAAILDVMLPGKDGYAVCREIRSGEKDRRTPVILLSALAQSSEIDKGIAAGADLYITKPYENADLLNKLRKLLSP